VQAVAGISFVLLVSCAWIVGIRLLLLARRTRALPETCLGAMFLSLMGLGYPLAVAAQAEAALGLSVAKTIQILSNGLIDFGFGLLFVFTLQVFRKGSRWALALCLAGLATLTAHFVIVAGIVVGLESMSDAIDTTRGWAQLSLGAGCAASLWTGIEALRYRAQLQRQLALGLTDPAVVNRFLLWGGMGLATAIGGLANVYFLLARIDVVSDPRALLVTSLVGIAQAALLLLGFFPPAAYMRHLMSETKAPQEL
jgi:hypothetical protein